MADDPFEEKLPMSKRASIITQAQGTMKLRQTVGERRGSSQGVEYPAIIVVVTRNTLLIPLCFDVQVQPPGSKPRQSNGSTDGTRKVRTKADEAPAIG